MVKQTQAVLLSAVIASVPARAEDAPSLPADEAPSVPAQATPAELAKELHPEPGEEVRFSVGLSESLGLAGVLSAQIYDRERFGDAYVVVGTTMLIINSVGLGWQHRFLDGNFTPYVNGTGFAVIGLPAMCSKPQCSIKVFPVISASTGVELRTRFEGRTNLHLQLGVWSAYNLGDLEFMESPSDQPYIWPVANVGWTRQF